MFIVEFMKTFGVSTAYAALPMSVNALVYTFAAPLAVMLGEKFTPQKLVYVGAVVGCLGIALSGLLINMPFVAVIFGVAYGIGNSCIIGSGLVMLGKYFRVRRSLANGIAHSGASVGQFAMPPLIEYLLETYGLGGMLVVVGGLYLQCLVAGALFRPIEQYGLPEESNDASEPRKEEGEVEEEELKFERIDSYNLVTIIPNEKDEIIQKNGDTPKLADETRNSPELRPLISTEEEPNNQDAFVETASCKGNADKKLPLKTPSYRELNAFSASTGSIYLAYASTVDISDLDRSALQEEETKSPCCLKRIVDFSILKNFVILLYVSASFIIFFRYFNFNVFLPPLVIEKGITKYDKALLVSICGVGDLIARVSVGFIADFNLIARYKIKATTCLLAGVNMFIFFFADTFSWLAVNSFLHGILGGGIVCLLPVVLIDFVGLDLMPKTLALVMFVQGVGGVVGQPFLGWVRDSSGTYNNVTLICSFSLGLGSILLFTYPLVKRLEEKKTVRV